jgi:maltooligosyltrehalose trehalohydrolase
MRRYPVGAEILPEGTHFRVWAPACRQVELTLEPGPAITMQAEPQGYFSAVAAAPAGTLYRYRLDGRGPYPDPASRFQPEGPHGPSQVVDSRFAWTDDGWPGRTLRGQVIYEMHIGTFTREGAWEAARRELAELAAAGITVLEVMPVADFPGRFNWGYDGVCLFAPTRNYGSPDDFRRFVNEAHGQGLGVLLDVVYNHIGPDGNYLKQFSPHYFTERYENDWGDAINFDGENCGPVREFFLANAAYWTEEFHLDGLRLDATQQIFDTSPEHILQAIGQRVRQAAGGRHTIVVAENDEQHSRLARPAARGGYALDGIWNDDFHHSAMVALTGHNEAYYSDYLGRPQEFISAVKHGYLFQGQRYRWLKKRRGTPAWGLQPAQFVIFIQNHDQIANAARGQRGARLAGPDRWRAMTALLLLAPNTPMLFQGQEFAASSPFLFFADHRAELAPQVWAGRVRYMEQFGSLARGGIRELFGDPGSAATFERCKLDFAQRERHAEIYQMHKDLLRLRREDPVFRRQEPGGVDGAVLGAEAFVLRFFGEGGDDRLLLVNFGMDLHLDPAPEPLLAPPEGLRWTVLWSSEDPRYGGSGTLPLDTEDNWRIPGHAAVAMCPEGRSGAGRDGGNLLAS